MASQIQVDNIASEDGTAPVTFPHGVSVPAGFAITAPDATVNGALTAGSFVGDGSALSGVSFATVAKTFAFSFIAT